MEGGGGRREGANNSIFLYFRGQWAILVKAEPGGQKQDGRGGWGERAEIVV